MRPNYKVSELTQDYVAQKMIDELHAQEDDRRILTWLALFLLSLLTLAFCPLWLPLVHPFTAGLLIGVSATVLLGILALAVWVYVAIPPVERGVIAGVERRG